MKTGFATMAAVITALLMQSAYAESGWTDYVRVAELIPTTLHYYEVRLPVTVNPSGCPEKTWFYQDYDTRGAQIMYQTLLEGTHSEFLIRVFVSGKCNINGYAEISSVSVVAR